MKTWLVTVPIVGTASIEVEAETAEDAIEEAINTIDYDNIDEWEALKRIASGNVLHTSQNEASAREV